MKKKMVSLFLTACLFVSSSALTVSASDYNTANFQNTQYFFNEINANDQQLSHSSNDNVSNAAGETILTRYSDGTISKTVYDNSELSTINCDEKQQSLPEYLPDNQIISATSVSSDEYGRELTNPTENRVGYLRCGFDTDGDNKSDIYYYGTASLQSYDILISCAHCIWKPGCANFYNDGWATEITFYAGRTSSTTYADTSNFISSSISQNYVDSAECYLDDNGEIQYRADLNYDWSIIRIDKNLGGTYGWFGLHGCGPVENGIDMKIIGYPTDKQFGSQWVSYGKITGFNEYNLVYFDAYFTNGNSGGPILGNDGCVYGIATIYAYDNDIWLYSGGVRIFDSLFQMIIDSREESAARWGDL